MEQCETVWTVWNRLRQCGTVWTVRTVWIMCRTIWKSAVNENPPVENTTLCRYLQTSCRKVWVGTGASIVLLDCLDTQWTLGTWATSSTTLQRTGEESGHDHSWVGAGQGEEIVWTGGGDQQWLGMPGWPHHANQLLPPHLHRPHCPFDNFHIHLSLGHWWHHIGGSCLCLLLDSNPSSALV